MHDLPRLAARLFGAPLMISQAKLAAILAAVGPRLRGEAPLVLPEQPVAPPQAQTLDEGIAVLPILGALVHRSSYLESACGLMSYLDIEAQAEALFADARVRAVILEIDSSGGEAAGVFGCAARLAELSAASGKPLWAVASESALSAAYALACAAERIYVSPTAEVGSVGVVAVHVDQSAADAQAGLAYTFVHAGTKKIDGNPHQPLSPQARLDIEADVQALHARLVAWVAQRRGLAESAVRAQEAAVYRGQDAIAAGLADALGGLREAIADLQTRVSQPAAASGRLIQGGLSMSTVMSVVEQAATSAAAEAMSPAPEQLLRQRAAEIVEIAEQARVLGVAVDAAAAIREGLAPDALRARVLKEAAARDAAADVVASHALRSQPESGSALLRAARAYAQQQGV